MSGPDESCCLPGDITVAQVHTGWMIGRALEQIGPGPWWHFIAIFPDLPTAIREARALARDQRVRVWFHEKAEIYHPIPLDDSPYSPPI